MWLHLNASMYKFMILSKEKNYGKLKPRKVRWFTFNIHMYLQTFNERLNFRTVYLIYDMRYRIPNTERKMVSQQCIHNEDLTRELMKIQMLNKILMMTVLTIIMHYNQCASLMSVLLTGCSQNGLCVCNVHELNSQQF